MKESRLALLLTLGIVLTYWGLTPGAPIVADSWNPGQGSGADVSLASAIVDVPFNRAGAGFAASPRLRDAILAVQPVILSGLIVLIVFLWSVRLTRDHFASIGYAIVAAFCTMIWPYAYLGMELTQSLALLVAAFIALALMPRRSWPLSILLGLTAGMALSAEPTSIFLLPAVAFLVIRAYAGQAEESRGRILVTTVIAAALVVANYLAGDSMPGHSSRFIEGELVSDPFAWAVYAVALIGSPGKGLIFYTPVVLVAAFALRPAWRNSPQLVIFTALTLGGLTFGLAMGDLWADETWGPRHLHAAVAPIVLMVAAARGPGKPLGLEYRATLIGLAVIGFLFSFAGVFFHHESQARAARSADRGTMQTIRMDPAWNHVKFNARLFRIWMTDGPGEEVLWTPELHWYYDRPKWAPEKMPPVSLSAYAVPQPLLARQGTRGLFGISLLLSLLGGLALIAYSAARARSMSAGSR